MLGYVPGAGALISILPFNVLTACVKDQPNTPVCQGYGLTLTVLTVWRVNTWGVKDQPNTPCDKLTHSLKLASISRKNRQTDAWTHSTAHDH